MVKGKATGILKIVCPDTVGIVAAVSGFLFAHHANIVDAQQHTDRSQSIFFMRVEFELGGMDLKRDGIADALAPVTARFGMRSELTFSDEMPVMGVMVSRL